MPGNGFSAAVGVFLALLLGVESRLCAQTATGKAAYVGSLACQTCHHQIYVRWTKTRMANVVRDPQLHPDAILPDFSKPDPPRYFHKKRYCLCIWKQVEATLL